MLHRKQQQVNCVSQRQADLCATGNSANNHAQGKNTTSDH